MYVQFDFINIVIKPLKGNTMNNKTEQARLQVEKLKELIRTQPWLSYKELGEHLGVTKQRIGQLIKQHNISYTKTLKPLSVQYGEDVINKATTLMMNNPSLMINEIRKQTGLTQTAIERLRYTLKLGTPQEEHSKLQVKILKQFVKDNNLEVNPHGMTVDNISSKLGWSKQKLNTIQRENNIKIYYPVGRNIDYSSR